jgi:predicted  nucleic acid-binding Zn-ribbon protein
MVNGILNRKLDDVLERLQFLRKVISNLKDRGETVIADVWDINERLFREIANYEMSTEELKKDFVNLMIDDANRLADACSGNIDILEKANNAFDKFNKTLEFINEHEVKGIKKSQELQDFAAKANEQLGSIRKDMDKNVKVIEDENRELDKEKTMQGRIKF